MIGVSERHRRPDISVVPRTPTRESCRYKATGTAASGMPSAASRPRAPAGARDLKAIPPRPNALRPTARQDHLAIGLHPAASPVPWPSVSGRIRRLYDFELEPEVRDWLDSLSDSDFKRVDVVYGHDFVLRSYSPAWFGSAAAGWAGGRRRMGGDGPSRSKASRSALRACFVLARGMTVGLAEVRMRTFPPEVRVRGGCASGLHEKPA